MCEIILKRACMAMLPISKNSTKLFLFKMYLVKICKDNNVYDLVFWFNRPTYCFIFILFCS